ncbi:hypothetical protein Tco_0788496 [Tanacetum coccineum]
MACLEKSDDNSEFHQIVDFLSTCFINYALTAVVISESSVRSDLLLNDEDGITCLTNAEIFENLALMGYEQLSTKLTFQKGGDSVERAITTDASLDAAQDSDNIFKTQSMVMPNVDIPQRIDTGGSPRRQDTMGGTFSQTRSERILEQPNEPPLSEGHTSGSGEGRMEHTFELRESVPPTPHDSPLPGGYTPGSDEGSLKLEELMNLCTNLSNRVLALETAKTAQDRVITRLRLRVRRLEKKRKARTSQPMKRRLFKGRVESSTDKSLDEEDAFKHGRYKDKTEPMFKESDFDELHDDMQDAQGETVDVATTRVSTVSAPVTTAGVAISTAEPRTPPTTTIVFDDEDVTMAMAQTLIKMKEQKAKKKGVAFREEEEAPRITTTRSITALQALPAIDPKDKGKGVLVEEKFDPSVKVKRSDQGDLQVQADAELAQLLHQEELAELERRWKEREAQEKASMDAIYDEYDNIQASINADALFAAKLQQEEKEQFTIEERA